MFGIPAITPFDLKFSLLGIPVRVHPMFWLFMALLGGVGDQGSTVRSVLIFVVCAFVSVLGHEMGHGVMTRLCGSRPIILLYAMGGLCVSEREQGPWQRLAVLVSGPGAGFLMAGLAFAAALGAAAGGLTIDPTTVEILNVFVSINIFWSIINLLPVWPLDGGQIVGVILTMISPSRGMQWTHALSLVAAGVLAFVSYQYLGSVFLAIFFAFDAFNNFQILQAMHAGSGFGAGRWDR